MFIEKENKLEWKEYFIDRYCWKAYKKHPWFCFVIRRYVDVSKINYEVCVYEGTNFDLIAINECVNLSQAQEWCENYVY